jgi:hypothetical protein
LFIVIQVSIVQAASKIMVYGASWDSEHTNDACYRHCRKKIEDDCRSPKICGSTRGSGRACVARVIETFVAPDPVGESPVSNNAKRNGGKCGTEHDACSVGRRL